jgi:hypothetical protein
MVDEEKIDLVQKITELINPKTGVNFTPFDAQRMLRSEMLQRAKAARRMQQYRRTRREMA